MLPVSNCQFYPGITFTSHHIQRPRYILVKSQIFHINNTAYTKDKTKEFKTVKRAWRSSYRVLVAKRDGNRSLGTPRRKCEDNIKTDITGSGLDSSGLG